MTSSLAGCLDAWAAIQPDTTLFAFDDGDRRRSFTYREFVERTRTLAAQLHHDERLERGDRVLLAYPPGLDCVVAFFACARAGVIPVPVHPPKRAVAASFARLEWIAADSAAKAVLSTESFAADVRTIRARAAAGPDARWIATDAAPAAASTRFDDQPGEVLFLQYTSGSTREPRGVVVSHANVIDNARHTIDHAAIGVSWLPQYHDMGLIGYYLFPVVCGGTTYGMSALDFLKRPARWFRTMSEVRATYVSAPNFGYEYCLRPGKIRSDELEGVDLGSVRVMMSAAEPVNADTFRRFAERFAACGLPADAHVAAYGLAENTLAVSHRGRRIARVERGPLSRHVVVLARQRTRERRDRAPVGGEHSARDVVELVSCGRPVDGVTVRIVDPQRRTAVPDGTVGEIWIAGGSVCGGYWNRPRLSERVFSATIHGDPADARRYLRSGDLGFLADGELFVCGRIKDVIIVRGANHYPNDIEAAAQAAFAGRRPPRVVAFGIDDGDKLVVAVEAGHVDRAPAPADIAAAIRGRCDVDPDVVVLVPPRTIGRTTSGKVARWRTRERYRRGTLPCLLTYRAAGRVDNAPGASPTDRFAYVYALGNGAGDRRTLAELGIDSLMLTELLLDLEVVLESHGATELKHSLDASLVQHLTLAQLSRVLGALSTGAIDECQAELERLRAGWDADTHAQMRADARLALPEPVTVADAPAIARSTLLTGATGFVGPFLLAALLQHTESAYHVLVRASDSRHATERVREGLRRAELWTPWLAEQFSRRVRVIAGDLAQPDLGLPRSEWAALARDVDTVFHNAARVNYVTTYEVMKPDNVDGTRRVLELACAVRPKRFHFVSSTFVFGWTVKGWLLESDTNEAMDGLDFGYAQSKWVAEQLVLAAGRQGLDVRVYRPSLLSVSTSGIGDPDDVALRLLAFMINHGVGVDTPNQVSLVPVDVAAHNIAAISAMRAPGARIFHVTADRYSSMRDVTELLTEDHGYAFAYHDIPGFIPEMNRRCTADDPLYPLLDFFNRSASKIAAMQLKRYRSDAYRDARARSRAGQPDPPLRQTVSAITDYMLRAGFIRVAADA